MNSCMNSYVQTLNSHTWIHKYEFMDINSSLKIEKNLVFWICDIEFRSQIWYEFAFMNSKNHNSDVCNEFLYELKFYKFMYLNLSENYCFHIISTAVVGVLVSQWSFKTAQLLLRPSQDQWINLETNEIESSAKQAV